MGTHGCGELKYNGRLLLTFVTNTLRHGIDYDTHMPRCGSKSSLGRGPYQAAGSAPRDDGQSELNSMEDPQRSL